MTATGNARRAVSLINLIRAERDWIKKCGGNLAGYVARYGDSRAPGDKTVAEGGRYGMGGQYIYEADVAALAALEDEYEAHTGHRY